MMPDFAVMNTLDLIVACGLISFMLLGVARGFTADFLGLFTWVGAFFVTALGFNHLSPLMRTFVSVAIVADFLSAFVLFIGSLIVLVWIVKSVSARVRRSVLSGLDRSLGLISGFCRGALFLVLGYMMALFYWKPGDRPSYVTQARSEPYLQSGGRAVHRFLIPDEFFPKRLLQHLYEEKRAPELLPGRVVEEISTPKPRAAENKPAEMKAPHASKKNP